jgi:hypothetical protein
LGEKDALLAPPRHFIPSLINPSSAPLRCFARLCVFNQHKAFAMQITHLSLTPEQLFVLFNILG